MRGMKAGDSRKWSEMTPKCEARFLGVTNAKSYIHGMTPIMIV